MNVESVLTDLVKARAIDVFVIAGRQLSYKLGGKILNWDDERMMPDDTEDFIQQIYHLCNDRPMDRLDSIGDDDFSFAIKGASRFRVNAYRQRGTLAAVIRVVPFDLPDSNDLNIPDEVVKLSQLNRGMVLVTGPAGSGKSTTLATIIDRINTTRNVHIITLENPIEFLHRHQMSLVSQRELQIDTENYAVALRAAMRQSPNVILIGELRDSESIAIALTAAETGHLVLSTLHTVGAANTVDRLIDSFNPSQQEQVRMQLSMVLECVVSQQLVRLDDGGLLPAFEIMRCNNAIRNLIREGRTHQIAQIIATSADEGMIGMDAALLKLYQEGTINASEMLNHAIVPELLAKQAGLPEDML
ncbi:MAG: PilT/PilU family type 4a pilus ATPase [Actinomycetia bacterium]|nr:PilT/PilU family type 4a pilus ATPase [Actinomycetes bacterium]